jgi:hypothetical protein
MRYVIAFADSEKSSCLYLLGERYTAAVAKDKEEKNFFKGHLFTATAGAKNDGDFRTCKE